MGSGRAHTDLPQVEEAAHRGGVQQSAVAALCAGSYCRCRVSIDAGNIVSPLLRGMGSGRAHTDLPQVEEAAHRGGVQQSAVAALCAGSYCRCRVSIDAGNIVSPLLRGMGSGRAHTDLPQVEEAAHRGGVQQSAVAALCARSYCRCRVSIDAGNIVSPLLRGMGSGRAHTDLPQVEEAAHRGGVQQSAVAALCAGSYCRCRVSIDAGNIVSPLLRGMGSGRAHTDLPQVEEAAHRGGVQQSAVAALCAGSYCRCRVSIDAGNIVSPLLSALLATWEPLSAPDEPIPTFLKWRKLLTEEAYNSLLWQHFVPALTAAAE
ncbi:hypothetical protein PYW07_009107 [Mythimna separata]|uniref:GCF C-terminal domain-containing protein n=1 Tax=Mythimna separata TaxID=271217 RepID=A0AAD7YBV5_MYTSE|nr:hypothetical protein PYW07_009107 [Mythimna separata]